MGTWFLHTNAILWWWKVINLSYICSEPLHFLQMFGWTLNLWFTGKLLWSSPLQSWLKPNILCSQEAYNLARKTIQQVINNVLSTLTGIAVALKTPRKGCLVELEWALSWKALPRFYLNRDVYELAGRKSIIWEITNIINHVMCLEHRNKGRQRQELKLNDTPSLSNEGILRPC